MNISRKKLEEVISQAVQKGFARAMSDIMPEIAALCDRQIKNSIQDLAAVATAKDSPAFLPYLRLRKGSLKESVNFIKEHMPQALLFAQREDIIKYALQTAAADGLYMECGVYKGRTINMLAELRPGKTIYGFDSFDGLPEDWSGTASPKGSFDMGGKMPLVRDNVRLIKGLFERTLPVFVKEHATEKAAFLHCYADLYSSTRCILESFAPMLAKGSVILFENFFNYPGWKEHEYKAFTEFAEKVDLKYRFTAVCLTQAALILE